MFGKSFKLFNLFGFQVSIDLSWFIIGLLVAWSLATGVFPHWHPELSTTTYWVMGASGALGLFISIIFHELCHSLVARHYGLAMGGITLFIFGGVAQMTEEPEDPKTEFFMAVAGPISSGLLGVFCLFLTAVAGALQIHAAVGIILSYLALLNFLLAGFNLIPGFPLDGGRILRSILWFWKGDLLWATKIAANIGSGFGMALIILGIFRLVFFGQIIEGIWSFLIGMFLRTIARSSYEQILIRQALSGETVADFMNDQPIAVDITETIEQLVEKYIYHYHHKVYPVVENGDLKGLVHSRQVRTIPREEWGQRTVAEITEPISSENTIRPDESAMTAFSRMSQAHASRLLAVDEQGLRGIISLKDLMSFFSLKLELENQETHSAVPSQFYRGG